MTRHAFPLLRAIVRPVDARDVHALVDEVAHERGVVGRFGRQGDHDPRDAPPRSRPEERIGVAVQRRATEVERERVTRGPRRGRSMIESGERSRHGRHHVGFAPTERRQTERSELPLERADIESTQRDVVHEVGRVFPVGGMDAQELRSPLRLGFLDRVLHGGKVVAHASEVMQPTTTRCDHLRKVRDRVGRTAPGDERSADVLVEAARKPDRSLTRAAVACPG